MFSRLHDLPIQVAFNGSTQNRSYLDGDSYAALRVNTHSQTKEDLDRKNNFSVTFPIQRILLNRRTKNETIEKTKKVFILE